MNTVLRLCLLLLLGLLPATPRAAEPLLLSAHPDFAPFMVRQDEEVGGMLPEIVRRAIERSGIRVSSRYVGPWARVQNNARTGELDAIAGIYENEERRAYLDFAATPLIENEALVIVRRGEAFGYNNWIDLRGRTLGRINGDRYPEDFERFLVQNGKDIRSDVAPSAELNFRKLLAGRVDTIIYSRLVSEYTLQRMGVRDQVELLPKAVFSGTFRFAISQQSPYRSALPEIDRQLARMRQSGEIDRIIRESQLRR